MNQQEREMIDGLFERLREAEGQQGTRDPEVEALIHERMASQPAAPYLLAQVVLMQEQGMRNLKGRVEQLEQVIASGRGSDESAGGGAREPAAKPPAAPKRSGWGNAPSPAAARPGMAASGPGQAAAAPAQGGGFLAGAMQTAMGVAGGVLIANAVSGLFSNDAEAADAEAAASDDPGEPMADEPMAEDEPMDAGESGEGGGLFEDFFGGDMFGGDDEF